MRRPPHQPLGDHRCHHQHRPCLGLGQAFDSPRWIWADNTSALSWMKNASNDTNPIILCLIRFLMAILIASGTPCILQGEHIPGEHNMGADRLSRPTLAPTWASIMMECPTVKLCQRCQVPPTLLSALASTISSGLIKARVAKEMIALLTHELLTSSTD
jgi:hypothetical protein